MSERVETLRWRSCLTFLTLLTGFTCNRPVSRLRLTCLHLEAQPSQAAHYRASVHLLVIREEWARRAHQKCFFGSGSKPLRPHRRMDDLVPRSPRDAFW